MQIVNNYLPFPENKFHVPFIAWERPLCDGERELCDVFPCETGACFLSQVAQDTALTPRTLTALGQSTFCKRS